MKHEELVAKAAEFARKFADAHYERGQTQDFYNELFEVFGNVREKVALYERRVSLLGEKHGYIDLFWPGTLIAEHKSANGSLNAAIKQAEKYAVGLSPDETPRYLLGCNFQKFRLVDLHTRDSHEFALQDLPDHVRRLQFLSGEREAEHKMQAPVSTEAARKLDDLRAQLKKSGYASDHLPEYMVRTLFCLFGDDADIFDGGVVERIIQGTKQDGADTGHQMHLVHQTLGQDKGERQSNLPDSIADLPYVGGMFKADGKDAMGRRRGRLDTPMYDAEMRRTLLDACAHDWSKVSPVIFGSVYERLMDPEAQRGQGAHYTSEENILKVINPLFMNDLRGQHARANERKGEYRARELRALHEKMGELKFLDPACGCGNFLVVAYKELRGLEIDIIRDRIDCMERSRGTQTDSLDDDLRGDNPAFSRVDVHQFHGIELNPFAAKLTEASLWMMDHLMNRKLTRRVTKPYLRIPVRKNPQIWCADALDLEWSQVLKAKECDYVIGNPPFKGYNSQSDEQSAQMERITKWAGGRKAAKSLDLVAGWFIKGGDYARRGGASVGLVATNSIAQGMQPAHLWPLVLDRNGLEITAAHQTFPWDHGAKVHVVTVQMEAKGKRAQKRLFSQAPDGSVVAQSVGAISSYLTDGSGLANPQVGVVRSNVPLNGLPPIEMGTQPLDNGRLILSDDERAALLRDCPAAKPYCRPFLSGRDFLHNQSRHILWLEDAPTKVRQHPTVRPRLVAVQSFRWRSPRDATRQLASMPTQFGKQCAPDAPFLVIPQTSSERRNYIPIGYLEPPAVPSNKIYLVQDAGKEVFALLNSRMHNAWVKRVGGRMKSDISYSTDLCYNTFPVPPGGKDALRKLEPHADDILAARAEAKDKDPEITLAQMYDSVAMPPQLRKAHEALDKAVDRMYRRTPFPSDQSRLGHLLAEYEKMTSPAIDAKHESRQRRAEAKEAGKMLRAGRQGTPAKLVAAPGAQGGAKVRSGDTLPPLFDRPESSLNPQQAPSKPKHRRTSTRTKGGP